MSRLKSAKEIPIGGLIDEAGSSRKFKTGDWRSFRPLIEESKCINCMMCDVFCPEHCISVKEDGKRGEIDLDYCKGCGICANVCPVKCIKMEEEAKFIK
ncbi:MAG: 4Fe-4S binding protein [Nanoarchaeota archaeon]|nr:4Fe-4S binding protein [Nanoarchaeota archaeon]MBU1004305.1 4Fe-4S binding protein [Nanoarchaeota archaeon]MBU1945477.1 4Fe-4S binding protein [Nanoarchaeota archaeon]